MTIRNILDTILSYQSGGIQSDDRRLHPKLVYNTLLGIRSTLIVNKINKKQFISDWTYQILPCVEFISVDTSLCPCIPPRGCSVMRSKLRIPKFLSSLSYHAIEGLYTADMATKFTYTTRSSFNTIKGNKYTSTTVKNFMIVDGYIYVYGKDIPEVMILKGILLDPMESRKFTSNCSGPGEILEDCSSILDIDIYIDPDLQDPLLEMTKEKLRLGFNSDNKDSITSNAREDDKKQ